MNFVNWVLSLGLLLPVAATAAEPKAKMKRNPSSVSCRDLSFKAAYSLAQINGAPDGSSTAFIGSVGNTYTIQVIDNNAYSETFIVVGDGKEECKILSVGRK